MKKIIFLVLLFILVGCQQDEGQNQEQNVKVTISLIDGDSNSVREATMYAFDMTPGAPENGVIVEPVDNQFEVELESDRTYQLDFYKNDEKIYKEEINVTSGGNNQELTITIK